MAEQQGGEEPAQPDGEGGARDACEGDGRIVPSRNREAQVRRDGERKLFDSAAKAEFLEWFAASCNCSRISPVWRWPNTE